MVKIAIDCRMLNKSGIGVYLANILYYWLKIPSVHWVLIGDRNQLEMITQKADCQIIDCKIPIFSLKEFFNFPISEINECDLFYSPNFNIPGGIKIPVYITIHDVVFLDIKGLSNMVGLWIRKFMMNRAFRLAEKIFTVSEFSKQRIIFHLGNKKEIIVAHNGLRVDLLDFDSTIAPKFYDFDYILFIGNIKKYKGLDILLKAIEDNERKLVIIGSVQNLKTSDKIIYEKIRLNKNIIVEGYIQNDQTLYSIIAHANFLVQPSRYEGFGIPPLEALYLGTPAIISDIQVFKEIYGKLPLLFFKDGDVEDLRLKLKTAKFPVINRQEIRNTYNYQTTASIILNKIR